MFNAFFVSLDALYYSSNRGGPEYQILLKSLESYLAGSLHAILGNAQAARIEFETALKLIGPVNARNYRDKIIAAMDTLHLQHNQNIDQ